MKKVLLINPPSALKVYAKAKLRVALPEVPLLSLATLAASIEKIASVQILDLMFSSNPETDLINKLKEYLPDYVGITFTTPLYYDALQLSKIIKSFNSQIITIAGGVHPTTNPENTLKESDFDIAVFGEGDITLKEIVLGKRLEDIKGICYKSKEEIIKNQPRPLIENLDELPFPAWHLYDLKRYKCSRLVSKGNPTGPIEPSRGCAFRCVYCGKAIFGRKIRFKSINRVINEMVYMKKMGFKEIFICDDNFASDIKRAKKICRILINKKLNLSWNLYNGVRVNCVDKEFFELARKAGCHQTGLGIESGNQQLLNNIHKDITLEQCRNAAKWAREAGLETVGYFMLGLPGETEETMKKTIDFAIELGLDYAKATIMLPFPSTEIYDEMKKKGLIKTEDWSKYNFHDTSYVYDHEALSWDLLHKYYNLFHKRFYLRPSYILRRMGKGLLNGNLFFDGYYFLKSGFIKIGLSK